jgi:hypothetical protein
MNLYWNVIDEVDLLAEEVFNTDSTACEKQSFYAEAA